MPHSEKDRDDLEHIGCFLVLFAVLMGVVVLLDTQCGPKAGSWLESITELPDKTEEEE